MTEEKVVGIVGAAGDLGRQLLSQVSERFEKTLAFDIGSKAKASSARWLKNPDDLLEQSDIIHWCAPIETVCQLPSLTKSQLLVLHNSVMANSLQAAQTLKKRPAINGSIAVVHLLMNQEKTVVVSSESDAAEAIAEHFKSFGWKPEMMKPAGHDILMAHTQAPMAILVHSLLPKLKQYDQKGLLTTSGQALKSALEDRSAAWTDTTLSTILANPKLPGFIEEIQNEIIDYQTKAK